jgi:hypothetical protein
MRYVAKKRRDFYLLWDTVKNKKVSNFKYDSLVQIQPILDYWNGKEEKEIIEKDEW